MEVRGKATQGTNPLWKNKLLWVRSVEVLGETSSAPRLEEGRNLTLVRGNLPEVPWLRCCALVNGTVESARF